MIEIVNSLPANLCGTFYLQIFDYLFKIVKHCLQLTHLYNFEQIFITILFGCSDLQIRNSHYFNNYLIFIFYCFYLSLSSIDPTFLFLILIYQMLHFVIYYFNLHFLKLYFNLMFITYFEVFITSFLFLAGFLVFKYVNKKL